MVEAVMSGVFLVGVSPGWSASSGWLLVTSAGVPVAAAFHGRSTYFSGMLTTDGVLIPAHLSCLVFSRLGWDPRACGFLWLVGVLLSSLACKKSPHPMAPMILTIGTNYELNMTGQTLHDVLDIMTSTITT